MERKNFGVDSYEDSTLSRKPYKEMGGRVCGKVGDQLNKQLDTALEDGVETKPSEAKIKILSNPTLFWRVRKTNRRHAGVYASCEDTI